MDNDEFEKLAEIFYKETGMLLPGKDSALGDHTWQERHKCWHIWLPMHLNIAELEAENLGLIQSLRTLEDKIAKDREAMRAVTDRHFAENQRLREAAQDVVETMRGSGGINLDAAEALLKLAALLGGEGCEVCNPERAIDLLEE